MPYQLLEINDADELSARYNGSHLRFQATERGAYAFRWELAQIGSFILQQTTFSLKTLVEGVTSEDVTNLLLSDAPPGKCVFTGVRMDAGDTILYGAGAEHFSLAKERTSFNLTWPRSVLENALAANAGIDSPDYFHARSRWSIGPSALLALRQLCVNTLQYFKTAKARHSPVETIQLEKSLLQRFTNTLSLENKVIQQEATSLEPSSRIILRARSFMEQAGSQPIYLHELCRATGVSARTLQKVFIETLGISPMRYLKVRRLHLARRRLMSTTSDQINVKQAAREAGFWEDGRFAEDYYRLFGFLPSKTLRVDA
ncbi:MAG: helix-turn-helix domain-containing protein [Planctomycetia bacterium]|nr:helix-turn-helix domain-containing protein [Planctomycetia bacterium]